MTSTVYRLTTRAAALNDEAKARIRTIFAIDDPVERLHAAAAHITWVADRRAELTRQYDRMVLGYRYQAAKNELVDAARAFADATGQLDLFEVAS